MTTTVHPSLWQLQEAKNRFSEVVSAAQTKGPQTITKHGQPVAMVVPMGTHDTPATNLSAWDLLRDDQVASMGGVPDLPPRTIDPIAPVALPW
jgi:prevent-host-death family protein